MEQQENNVTIIGTVSEPFKLSHTLTNLEFDSKIYTTTLDIKRLSEVVDKVPVEIKAAEYFVESFNVGEKVLVEGEVRTYNIDDHLKIIILAKRLNKVKDEEDKNEVEMAGYICRKPVFRITPFGRKICDVLVAIPVNYKRSAYVPCILWGKNAEYVANLDVGTRLSLDGRMQSREYRKKISEEEYLTKTAIEVSCNMVALI